MCGECLNLLVHDFNVSRTSFQYSGVSFLSDKLPINSVIPSFSLVSSKIGAVDAEQVIREGVLLACDAVCGASVASDTSKHLLSTIDAIQFQKKIRFF